MSRAQAYWLCQIAGWSIFFGIQMSVRPENWASGETQTTLLTWALRVSLGIGLTHAIRAYAKRQGWATLSLKRLVPRAAVAAVVSGTFFTGVENVLIAFSPLQKVAHYQADPPPADGAIGATTVIGVWLAIYFGVRAARSYRQAEIDQWKLQAQAEAARLEALKLQLNPHFFFNSLASVRSLISEAPGRAKKMVARLARLLRKTLQASEEETVPLEEELATTKTYLELEKVRFEDRLSWHIDVEEKALGLPVPQMLVQTLVENAVKHGVAQRQGGGVVRVEAAIAGETDSDGEASRRKSEEEKPSEENTGGEKSPLCLQVTNPGELGEEAGAERGSGTGLKNARERLRLLFGEAASLALEQSGPETVTATVRISRAGRASGKTSPSTPQTDGEGASPGRRFVGSGHVGNGHVGNGHVGNGQNSSPRPAEGQKTPEETAEVEPGPTPSLATDSPDAKSNGSCDWGGSWAYWTCQLAGWGGLLGVTSVAITVTDKNIGGAKALVTMAIMVVLFGGIGIAITHAFRVYAKRKCWADLPPRRLLPRAGVAAALMGSIYVTFPAPLMLYSADLPTRWGPWLWAVLNQAAPPVDAALGFSVLMGLWIAIYFGVHAVWNYRQAEIDRWKLQTRAETARLEALKLQLNPHFFFNSLASVRSLISEAPGRARRMVGRLARLLREALQAGDAKTVPLKDELSTTRTYLKLEKVRFEDRLSWTVDASEAALQRQVPYMLVQTLAENAVKHGIGQRRAGGTIQVEATVAGGTESSEDSPLCLKITNPGELGEEASAERGSGTGLENARERLRLLFGEAASLALEQSGPETVTATARIPRPRPEALEDRPLGKNGFSDPARAPGEVAPARTGGP
ncbi:sensor histidine kinase [Salinibacter altiplanensis]|uniref:sensor histidine kinase n=1 Tax=Salinibacter altiplanensis TaxID=1803181 RepID=UPI001F38F3FE|nr:histidine kinase [Salinibacter altiplanensis]